MEIPCSTPDSLDLSHIAAAIVDLDGTMVATRTSTACMPTPIPARAAGCPVVLASYGCNHGEPVALARPDRVIDRLDELFAASVAP